MAAVLQVTVHRGTAGARRAERFEVPSEANQTVLDVVSWIQQNADPTLSYRFACRVGMCGSCAMMVNGVPRWTCRTHVQKVVDRGRNGGRDGGRIEIGPLANLPVIKDLAVDMAPFFDKWVAAGAHHHPTATRADAPSPVRPDSAAREVANAGIECINCAVCYAACDTVAHNPDYLGPAALQRAWTLLNDDRDGGHEAILDAVSGFGGCHNCHSIGSCTLRCPNELDPMTAIAGLKRASARRVWRRG